MYAVIKSGGKQYRVEAGKPVRVETLLADVGSAVAFEEVLLVGSGDSVKVGAPLVTGAKVKGTVVAHGRSDTRSFADSMYPSPCSHPTTSSSSCAGVHIHVTAGTPFTSSQTGASSTASRGWVRGMGA